MTTRRYIASAFLCFSALGLASCAYTVEKSHQDITFTTPGAEYAACDVYVDKLRYQVHPPQTINIKKSDGDMEIRCVAPGNREKRLSVPSGFASRAVWGTPAGMAWDYASESLFSYPSVIAIDFSQEANKPNTLPRHNSPDIRQPEDYDLEEYLPGEPRLNRDRYKKADPIRRRDDLAAQEAAVVEAPIGGAKAATKDKGELIPAKNRVAPKPVALSKEPSIMPLPEEALEDSIPPSSVMQPKAPAGAKPVPLFPGE